MTEDELFEDVKHWKARAERLQDALQQLVDYVKDGCPDDGRYYVMTEAQASLKGIALAFPSTERETP